MFSAILLLCCLWIFFFHIRLQQHWFFRQVLRSSERNLDHMTEIEKKIMIWFGTNRLNKWQSPFRYKNWEPLVKTNSNEFCLEQYVVKSDAWLQYYVYFLFRTRLIHCSKEYFHDIVWNFGFQDPHFNFCPQQGAGCEAKVDRSVISLYNCLSF